MNRILYLLIPLGLLVVFSFQDEKESRVKVWSGSSCLQAADFRMERAPAAAMKTASQGKNGSLEGYIFCGIEFSYEVEGTEIQYKVIALMEPDKSWLRDSTNRSTLEHEQAHFNIAEVYARRIRRELAGEQHPERAKSMVKRNLLRLQKRQIDFDKDHVNEEGLNSTWKTWIDQELSSLTMYQENQFTVYKK
ncbi:MAG: hypothetical protein JNL88_10565 [Bacteroidia bacterium]|nr:hypothetical protein [Bacteroidia bacterium]